MKIHDGVAVRILSAAILCVLMFGVSCGDSEDEESDNGDGGEWVLVEAAAWDGDRIVLTPDLGDQVGGAWYTASFDLTIDFDLSFQMYLGDKDEEGADGIVFVIATESVAAEVGEGLGYQGIVPSIGVEFDTYANDGVNLGGDLGDPPQDHVTVDLDGSADHHNTDRPISLVDNLEDGQEHALRIRWTAATGALVVTIDGTTAANYAEDFITDNLGGEHLVRLGFTGSTGALSNLQYIVPVEFESNRGE